MRVQDFNYSLDPSRIAQNPITPRDHSKLMVLSRATHKISHYQFKDLPRLINPGDTLVTNDTAVIPVRLVGNKRPSGGRVDCCLTKEVSLNTWEAFVRGKVRDGQDLEFSNSITATVKLTDQNTTRKLLHFHGSINLRDQILNVGQPPLPPYIKRTPNAEDFDRYQTVYAKTPGAIAAPTAGLHFTANLLKELCENKVSISNITLHTGLGTFLPMQKGLVENHYMEPEYFQVTEKALQKIQKTKTRGGRVIAVGTTTVKALETVAKSNFPNEGQDGETSLFIYPGFCFQTVDAMITNFHLPQTTLLMLVCAFAGKKLILDAYQKAIDNNYRFYSYGDAMLIL